MPFSVFAYHYLSFDFTQSQKADYSNGIWLDTVIPYCVYTRLIE